MLLAGCEATSPDAETVVRVLATREVAAGAAWPFVWRSNDELLLSAATLTAQGAVPVGGTPAWVTRFRASAAGDSSTLWADAGAAAPVLPRVSDGGDVFLVKPRPGALGLVLRVPAGGGAPDTIDARAVGLHVGIAPDGGHVAFLRRFGADIASDSIVLIDRRTGALRVVGAGGTGVDQHRFWVSPDGSRVITFGRGTADGGAVVILNEITVGTRLMRRVWIESIVGAPMRVHTAAVGDLRWEGNVAHVAATYCVIPQQAGLGAASTILYFSTTATAITNLGTVDECASARFLEDRRVAYWVPRGRGTGADAERFLVDVGSTAAGRAPTRRATLRIPAPLVDGVVSTGLSPDGRRLAVASWAGLLVADVP